MDPKAKMRGFRPKPGEAYGRIEAPKGELGFYLISDGSPESVSLPRAAAELDQSDGAGRHVPGPNVADVVIIFGSVDIVLGEVDR